MSAGTRHTGDTVQAGAGARPTLERRNRCDRFRRGVAARRRRTAIVSGTRVVRPILLGLCLGFGALASAQDDGDEARGKAVFENYCIHCHGTEPHNSGATVMLEEKYAGAVPGSLEERTTLTPEFIREFVRGDIGMAAYRPTEIPDSDLQALTAYLMRNNP